MTSVPNTPSELPESSVMTIWPTVAATRTGRLVGQWCSIRAGLGGFLTIGNLLALATIPITLAVFFWQLMPYVCRRYQLTNRRIVVRKGLSAAEGESIALDALETIDVEVLPGQAWYHAGDLVFRRDGSEVFRLAGVSRPESFRQVCLKTRAAMLSVRNVLRQQATSREPVS